MATGLDWAIFKGPFQAKSYDSIFLCFELSPKTLSGAQKAIFSNRRFNVWVFMCTIYIHYIYKN